MSKRKHIRLTISFFVGSDITSHLILNSVVKALVLRGHKIYIFLTPNKPNPLALPELKELFFYERTLLNDFVYPFLKKKRLPLNAECTSPELLAEEYKGQVFFQEISNVNDKKFLLYLSEKKITAGISIRCYQKFGKEIIEYFTTSKAPHPPFFVNLHPGLLPEYRGVTTFCRSMQNKDKTAGFTLHYINTFWDAGDIIVRKASPLDYSLSVVENMCMQTSEAAEIVLNVIEKLEQLQVFPSKPQSKIKAHYYTHPSVEDLSDFRKKKIFLIRRNQIKNLLVKKFTSKGSLEESQLVKILNNASH